LCNCTKSDSFYILYCGHGRDANDELELELELELLVATAAAAAALLLLDATADSSVMPPRPAARPACGYAARSAASLNWGAISYRRSGQKVKTDITT